jgi:hypothetical protein
MERIHTPEQFCHAMSRAQTGHTQMYVDKNPYIGDNSSGETP